MNYIHQDRYLYDHLITFSQSLRVLWIYPPLQNAELVRKEEALYLRFFTQELKNRKFWISCCAVLCQPWSFLFRRSILYVYSQTSLRFVNIILFSSNSLSLVLFISPRCCILVFYPFCLLQLCQWRAQNMLVYRRAFQWFPKFSNQL